MKEQLIQIRTAPKGPTEYYPLDLFIKVGAVIDHETIELWFNPTINTMGESGEDFTGSGARYEIGEGVSNVSMISSGPGSIKHHMSMNKEKGPSKGEFEVNGKTYQIELQGITPELSNGKEYPTFIALVRDCTP